MNRETTLQKIIRKTGKKPIGDIKEALQSYTMPPRTNNGLAERLVKELVK